MGFTLDLRLDWLGLGFREIRDLLHIFKLVEMPLGWLKGVNDKFLLNLAKMDAGKSKEILQELIANKKSFLKNN